MKPTRPFTVVAVAVLALAMGGCGEGDRAAAPARSSPADSATPSTPPPGTPTGTTPSTAPATRTPAPPASPAPTPPVEDLTPTAGGKPKGTVITVSGTVRRGVEGGCLVLQSAQGRYTLILQQPNRALLPGARVAVTGRVDEGGMSVCQEGKVLRVLSVGAG